MTISNSRWTRSRLNFWMRTVSTILRRRQRSFKLIMMTLLNKLQKRKNWWKSPSPTKKVAKLACKSRCKQHFQPNKSSWRKKSMTTERLLTKRKGKKKSWTMSSSNIGIGIKSSIKDSNSLERQSNNKRKKWTSWTGRSSSWKTLNAKPLWPIRRKPYKWWRVMTPIKGSKTKAVAVARRRKETNKAAYQKNKKTSWSPNLKRTTKIWRNK